MYAPVLNAYTRHQRELAERRAATVSGANPITCTQQQQQHDPALHDALRRIESALVHRAPLFGAPAALPLHGGTTHVAGWAATAPPGASVVCVVVPGAWLTGPQLGSVSHEHAWCARLMDAVSAWLACVPPAARDPASDMRALQVFLEIVHADRADARSKPTHELALDDVACVRVWLVAVPGASFARALTLLAGGSAGDPDADADDADTDAETSDADADAADTGAGADADSHRRGRRQPQRTRTPRADAMLSPARCAKAHAAGALQTLTDLRPADALRAYLDAASHVLGHDVHALMTHAQRSLTECGFDAADTTLPWHPETVLGVQRSIAATPSADGVFANAAAYAAQRFPRPDRVLAVPPSMHGALWSICLPLAGTGAALPAVPVPVPAPQPAAPHAGAGELTALRNADAAAAVAVGDGASPGGSTRSEPLTVAQAGQQVTTRRNAHTARAYAVLQQLREALHGDARDSARVTQLARELDAALADVRAANDAGAREAASVLCAGSVAPDMPLRVRMMLQATQAELAHAFGDRLPFIRAPLPSATLSAFGNNMQRLVNVLRAGTGAEQPQVQLRLLLATIAAYDDHEQHGAAVLLYAAMGMGKSYMLQENERAVPLGATCRRGSETAAALRSQPFPRGLDAQVALIYSERPEWLGGAVSSDGESMRETSTGMASGDIVNNMLEVLESGGFSTVYGVGARQRATDTIAAHWSVLCAANRVSMPRALRDRFDVFDCIPVATHTRTGLDGRRDMCAATRDLAEVRALVMLVALLLKAQHHGFVPDANLLAADIVLTRYVDALAATQQHSANLVRWCARVRATARVVTALHAVMYCLHRDTSPVYEALRDASAAHALWPFVQRCAEYAVASSEIGWWAVTWHMHTVSPNSERVVVGALRAVIDGAAVRCRRTSLAVDGGTACIALQQRLHAATEDAFAVRVARELELSGHLSSPAVVQLVLEALAARSVHTHCLRHAHVAAYLANVRVAKQVWRMLHERAVASKAFRKTLRRAARANTAQSNSVLDSIAAAWPQCVLAADLEQWVDFCSSTSAQPLLAPAHVASTYPADAQRDRIVCIDRLADLDDALRTLADALREPVAAAPTTPLPIPRTADELRAALTRPNGCLNVHAIVCRALPPQTPAPDAAQPAGASAQLRDAVARGCVRTLDEYVEFARWCAERDAYVPPLFAEFSATPMRVPLLAFEKRPMPKATAQGARDALHLVVHESLLRSGEHVPLAEQALHATPHRFMRGALLTCGTPLSSSPEEMRRRVADGIVHSDDVHPVQQTLFRLHRVPNDDGGDARASAIVLRRASGSRSGSGATVYTHHWDTEQGGADVSARAATALQQIACVSLLPPALDARELVELDADPDDVAARMHALACGRSPLATSDDADPALTHGPRGMDAVARRVADRARTYPDCDAFTPAAVVGGGAASSPAVADVDASRKRLADVLASASQRHQRGE